MRRVLIALMFIVAFSSCNNKKEKQAINPVATIALNPGVDVKSDNPEHCTAREIVEWTWIISANFFGERGFADAQRDFVNNRLFLLGTDVVMDGDLNYDFLNARDVVLIRRVHELWGRTYYTPHLMFDLDEKMDNVIVFKYVYNPQELDKLKEVRDTIDIIPVPDDIDISDGHIYILDYSKIYSDTIGYIPNKIGIDVVPKIKAAYAKGDYDACYDIFDKAYQFYPITGAEWRELKRQGIE